VTTNDQPQPEKSERTSAGPAIAAVAVLFLVVLPVLYLGAAGPIVWMERNGYVSQYGESVLRVVYAPVRFRAETDSEALAALLDELALEAQAGQDVEVDEDEIPEPPDEATARPRSLPPLCDPDLTHFVVEHPGNGQLRGQHLGRFVTVSLSRATAGTYVRVDADGLMQLPPEMYFGIRTENGGFGYGGSINVIDDEEHDDAVVLDVSYYWKTPDQVRGQLKENVPTKIGVPLDVQLSAGSRLQATWREVPRPSEAGSGAGRNVAGGDSRGHAALAWHRRPDARLCNRLAGQSALKDAAFLKTPRCPPGHRRAGHCG
jgi:hypothetical protein